MKAVDTVCPYCGVGCGVSVTVDDDTHEVSVKGDYTHPANAGRLCVKGSALAETLGLESRLLNPRVDGLQASWDHALSAVAHRLQDTIARYGPDSVAFYVSGQLLTEDYYVANKLIKGFIGTANIDTNSRLCMSTAVAAHKRVLGSDTVPGCYQDVELADLLVITGSNMAWTHPVVYQRIVAAKQARPQMKIVVIDPRQTATSELADLHLQIAPGSDIWLFDGLLAWLLDSPALDAGFIDNHTENFAGLVAQCRQRENAIDSIADKCELDPELLRTFYQWFVRTAKTVTVFSQGINQSAYGVDQASLILYCHLVTGRIGKPGASPFSITGQPNAMGGREVGGLANQLAAHMDIENPLHHALVSKFWQTQTLATKPGLKAVDMFRAVADGNIRFIWVMATNPVVSMPEADLVRAALQNCEHVVVSDCVADTDTTRLAHVLLPAAAWGEKSGTVTNSERCISRQRGFLPLPGDAQPDWWIVSEIAKRLGFAQAFNYQGAADIFREHAALSAFGNNGTRDFDIGALAQLENSQYEEMQPLQWPLSKKRMFADGQFFTPSGRAQFIAVEPASLPQTINAEYPLWLNTGRIRDQWHTMTRTGLSSKLQKHTIEPFVEMHPADMQLRGLQAGDLTSVNSRHGQCVVRVHEQRGQTPGTVFMPIHWNDCFASSARVGKLVSAICDPVSGQPAFKQTPVSVSRLPALWYACLISPRRLSLPETSYWCTRYLDGLYFTVLAGDQGTDANTLMSLWTDSASRWAQVEDSHNESLRLIGRDDNGVQIWFAMQTTCVPDVDEDWLIASWQQAEVSIRDLMLGRPSGSQTRDKGKLICTCHQVYDVTINAAIHEGCDNTADIGRKTRAGTNCGSCTPELDKLLKSEVPGQFAGPDTPPAKEESLC
ncbi:nitrate reductase [Pseudohongiella sp.]|uniref:4Fe-4S Mo/W bis-MGD-type domain-containing protein n=1 Tax=marine sediment metagenome TaxID=412755 RepID=A0A0F9WJY4_9ZZZZ|nr:nitrate reductase [Pseudohongiella sp.]HDZ09493.1 nitrate reductase [Pseudohongiella sp.]HEA63935.1 nitrate reductase [Pseudohongiella sp.]